VGDGIERILADGVLELRFDRADKKNAITAAMYRIMTAGLEEAAGDPAIAAVLFSGEGDMFSAGNDLKDFLSGPDGASAAMAFVRALAVFAKPVVAAVQGQAVGIGTTMLLHCDLVYAAPDARFTVPFARLGLVPEAGSSLLLPARIGHARAAQMFLLGEPLDAQGAETAGLVTAIVPADRLREHARAKAVALGAMPPQGLARTRALMKGDPAALLACIEEESKIFGEALGGAEAKEAFTAFFEKRAPVFRRG
jgi:enoyl-CoA hydratase/carnithine racemase